MTAIQQQQDWLDKPILGLENWMHSQHIRGINDGSYRLTPDEFKAAITAHFKQIIIDSDRTYTNEHDRQVANDYKASILAQLNGKAGDE